MSDSVRPHGWQPTSLPCRWDSPGKNTGVGCHVLLQGMKVKSGNEVAKACLTLSDPMDCSPPGFSIHGIFQAKHWSGEPLPPFGGPLLREYLQQNSRLANIVNLCFVITVGLLGPKFFFPKHHLVKAFRISLYFLLYYF